MPRQTIYFIADVHLVSSPDAAQRRREASLIRFLRHIRSDAEVLYIVGDLFDFWFEYRSAVPRTGARVLFELHRLVESGVRVVCLPGNHDIWLGSYLRDEVGLELPGGPTDVTHQGVRCFLAHGDEFRADLRFRISRGILKSPACIALFRLLHPDLGSWLGHLTSSLSEYRLRGRGSRDVSELRRLAKEKLASGFQAFISGHYHQAVLESLPGGTLIVLGDWIARSTYARLRDGRLELRDWREDRPE